LALGATEGVHGLTEPSGIGSKVVVSARTAGSEVLWREARRLGDSGQHARADLDVVVEGEHDVSPTRTGKCSMRSGAALDRPTNALESRQDAFRLG
jgi:hypothetical protein